LKPFWFFLWERTYVDGRATNLYGLIYDGERQVIGLERDIGWVLKRRCEVGVDILVSTTTAASFNTDIAETGGVSKTIDAYVRGCCLTETEMSKIGTYLSEQT